jgi:hypothetical protein
VVWALYDVVNELAHMQRSKPMRAAITKRDRRTVLLPEQHDGLIEQLAVKQPPAFDFGSPCRHVPRIE